MKTHSLEPASSVIDLFGGPVAVAKILGLDRAQVYRWMYPKCQRGTDGLIPSWHQQVLLAHAKRNKIPLTAEMLIMGPESRSKRGR